MSPAMQSTLSLLPNPTNSSVTKMDLRTSALLAKPATGLGGTYDPVLPIGFYTSFDGYLASNLSVIDDLKERGWLSSIRLMSGLLTPSVQVHYRTSCFCPCLIADVRIQIPTFDNLTALNLVIDRMQAVGLYLMYDMRFTYMNLTSVTEQVNMLKNRPNLLLWYTGDEPDGTSDPLNAAFTKFGERLAYCRCTDKSGGTLQDRPAQRVIPHAPALLTLTTTPRTSSLFFSVLLLLIRIQCGMALMKTSMTLVMLTSRLTFRH